MAAAAVLLGMTLLLLVWCLFLSRFPWRLRFIVVGGFFVTVLLVASLFRIKGVDGDLIPVLNWRWDSSDWVAPGDSSRSGSHPSPALTASLTNSYPQFLGPNRNGTVDHLQLAQDWTGQSPKLLWRHPVGLAWSGFAILGHRAITQEQRGESETVNCYDLATGVPLWSFSYLAHFQSTLAGEGPRATPTIARSKVFTVGSTGILNCLDLETGQVLWSRNLLQDNQASLEEWGMSGSPLFVDDQVVVSVGGKPDRSLVAYRAGTGEFAWGGGADGSGYGSPFVTELAARRQILVFNSGGVAAHDPVSGVVLWKYRWPGGHPHVTTPIVLPEDLLLVSSGYGVGSELLKIEADPAGNLTAKRIWKSNRLKSKFANLVYLNGYIYGLDDGIMVCLDATTGAQKWKQGRYGHGQVILVDDLLLVGAESGEVVLLAPNPSALRELGRFSALHGKTWNPPALAGEFLLVRNDKEAACYRLPLVAP